MRQNRKNFIRNFLISSKLLIQAIVGENKPVGTEKFAFENQFESVIMALLASLDQFESAP